MSFSAACMACLWRSVEEPAEALTCRAFPEGIPWDIISGWVSHREPYPGQDDPGVVYEPDPMNPRAPARDAKITSGDPSVPREDRLL